MTHPKPSAEALLLDTEFLVEATSYETLELWNDFSDGAQEEFRKGLRLERLVWEQDGYGWGAEVGQVTGLPVVVSLLWATIGGRRVCFYEATSRIVDHDMIEAWLVRHTPKLKRRENAMNFHNVANEILRGDK